MTFSSARDEVIWIGGSASGRVLTWGFSHGVWSNLTAGLASRPPAREWASAADDPAASAVVLFGGWNGSTYLADTWALNASGWSSVVPARSPGARAEAGLAYEGSASQLLLVGGENLTGTLRDAWTFANSSWTLAAVPPAGIVGTQAATSAPGGAVEAFGGVGCGVGSAGPCNTTFSFSGGTWAVVPTNAPPPRLGMDLTYDGNASGVVGWGGSVNGVLTNETWVLGGPVRATETVAQAHSSISELTPGPTFDAEASGGYGSYAYVWANGPLDCTFPAVASVPCDTEIPGNYTVSVTVTDGGGNATVAVGYATVYPEFGAGAVVTPSVVDLGQSIQLSTRLAGGTAAANYSWLSVPTGCPLAYTNSFSCTPVSAGFFLLEVQAVDTIGDRSVSPPVGLLVNADPAVTISYGAGAIAAPATLDFQATVTGGTAPFVYRWAFSDGGASNASSADHTFAVAGTYFVNLTVIDAANDTSVATTTSVVVPRPLTVGIAPGPRSLRTGDSAGFSATTDGGTPPYTTTWYFGDGAESSGVSTSHAFASAGAYSVVVVVSDARGLVATSTATVDVSASGGGASSVDWSVYEALAAGVTVGAIAGAAVVLLVSRRSSRLTSSPTSPRSRR